MLQRHVVHAIIMLAVAVTPLPARAAAQPAASQPAAAPAAEAQADREFAAENYTAAEQHYREALAAAPGRAHSTLQLAKLLSWRDQFDESIALYKQAIAAQPSNQAARRELATVYGWAERYPESLALYKEMMAAAPADRALVIEYARTQAWSGDLKGAERTLGELVSSQPRDPLARLELAKIYGWDNRLGEGEKIYRSVLQEKPDNMAGLTGLAENLSWQGRYDEALFYYDKALAIQPENKDAMAGKARTYSWQGRHAEALAATREALALYPEQADIQRLGRTIGGSLRPMLSLFATTTQDSDDNDIHTWGGRYTHYLTARTWIGGMYTHAQLSSLLPEEVVGKYDTARVTGGAHLPGNVTITGELGMEWTTVPVASAGGGFADIEEHTHGAGLLEATVDPARWFSFTGSYVVERLIGTVPTLQNDVGIRALTGTVVFRPHNRVTLRAWGQVADLTDGNAREMAGGGVDWLLPVKRPDISVRGGGRWVSYDEDLNNGYFDPDKLLEWTVGVTVSDTIGPRFYWSASMDRGMQQVEDFDSTDVLDYEVLAGVNIAESLAIEAYYGRSDSAFSSPSGFSSTTGGVRARIRFGHVMGAAAPDHTGRP